MNLKSVKPETWVKVIVTVGSVALLGARMWRPDRVDATSMGFLVVAILPWLSSIFESIQFPGGGGVTFRAAVERATQSGDAIIAASPPPVVSPEPVEARSPAAAHLRPRTPLTATDPNLAFVALRIDLERTLASIASRHGVSGRTTRELVRNIVQSGIVPDEVGNALNNLIYVGNQAAHGKPIDTEAGRWAREHGPEVLGALERIAGESAGP